MLLFLLKRKRFVVSSLFLIGLFTWSILQSTIFDGEINQVRFRLDENSNVLSRPPYPPLTEFLLGSDVYGYDLLIKLVVGAKWTIGITLAIVIFRMVISIIFSSLVYSMPNRLYNGLKAVFEPFTVVPQTIVAYFILYSVLWMPVSGFSTPFWQRAFFETFILGIIAIPNVTIHLSAEMRLVQKESFIEASRILGASKPHLFFKHIVPHVYEKWILLFGQQFIHTLQLLAHLGFMKLFFGGTFVPYGSPGLEDPHSISYEWSGVIGGDISYLYSHHWIVLIPIGFFIFTAISVALINDSIRMYFQSSARMRFAHVEK
ncbi:ABC transporter permease subunit [Neobacillus sp. 19]|uniref:ABC transporter permease subunit n=1 Tax=Neobacillus sp. 19 TaxID=3394458 RepID=UPI003BF650BA